MTPHNFHAFAIALKATSSGGYFARATVKRARGDQAGALADLNKAIEFDPRNIRALAGRAGLRAIQGDKAGAMTDYNLAIEVRPFYGEAYLNRAAARRAAGDLAGAKADEAQAAKLAAKPAVKAVL